MDMNAVRTARAFYQCINKSYIDALLVVYDRGLEKYHRSHTVWRFLEVFSIQSSDGAETVLQT